MIIVQSQFNFNYEDSQSFEQNFTDWYLLNCQERTQWGETPYSREEGFEVFSNLFEKKVDKV